MIHWLHKFWGNMVFRYFLGFGMGVFLSVLLNDVPFFNQWLQKITVHTEYNRWLTIATYWQLKMVGTPVLLQNLTLTVNEHSFYFAHGCLGLRHLAIFAGFMMIYFGKWNQKLIYCLVGFLVLTFANIMRATLIGIALWINPNWFEPVHRHGSAFVLYGTIFLLWIIWVKHTENLSAKL